PANEAGGNDNATVVVVDVLVGEPSSAETTGAHAGDSAAAALAVPGGPESGGASAPSGSTLVESPPESPPSPPSEPIPAGTITNNGAGAAVVSRSAPDTDLARPPSPRYDPRTGARNPRRITFRVLLFLVVVGGLAYAGYASIRWYVHSSYFIGLSHNQVVIYQGRPGGFVGMNPK